MVRQEVGCGKRVRNRLGYPEEAMRIRRILRAVFGVATVMLIGAYFYMRVEHFPTDRVRDIWMVAMLFCWISVVAAWRDRPGKKSEKD